MEIETEYNIGDSVWTAEYKHETNKWSVAYEKIWSIDIHVKTIGDVEDVETEYRSVCGYLGFVCETQEEAQKLVDGLNRMQ